MKTTKAISTISFNSKPYLIGTLNSFVKNKIATFWAIIEHRGEDDEAGLKDHFHVYIEPSKLLQTDDLREKLIEPVPNNKPLGSLPFRTTSDFADWYKYTLHDKAYLATKMLQKKYHYSSEQYITSDEDYFLYLVKNVQFTETPIYERVLYFKRQGFDFGQFIRSVNAPIQQIKNLQILWSSVSDSFRIKYTQDTETGYIFRTKEYDETPMTKQEYDEQQLLKEKYDRQERMKELEDSIATKKLSKTVSETAEGSETFDTILPGQELPF